MGMDNRTFSHGTWKSPFKPKAMMPEGILRENYDDSGVMGFMRFLGEELERLIAICLAT